MYPFGSYGPAAGAALGDAVSDETEAPAGGAVAARAAGAAAFGAVSLSASALAGEFGRAPGAVAAVAAGDVTGIDMLGGRVGKPATPAVAPGAAGVPAAARLVDDGEAAGVRPATATGVGVDWLDGNFGSAVRATADASGRASFFQNAHFGPD